MKFIYSGSDVRGCGESDSLDRYTPKDISDFQISIHLYIREEGADEGDDIFTMVVMSKKLYYQSYVK